MQKTSEGLESPPGYYPNPRAFANVADRDGETSVPIKTYGTGDLDL